MAQPGQTRFKQYLTTAQDAALNAVDKMRKAGRWAANSWVGQEIRAIPSGVRPDGFKDVVGSMAHYLRGADKTMFTKTEHTFSNILGRKPQPWLLGSLAFAAFAMGSDMGEKIYQGGGEPQMTANPQILDRPTPEWVTDPHGGQVPALTSAGIQHLPDDMNSVGLVQALHKNRHG